MRRRESWLKLVVLALSTLLVVAQGPQPAAASSSPRMRTAAQAFRAVRRAHLLPVPLWPSELPPKVRNAKYWSVSNLGGRQPEPQYPDYFAYGRTAFEVGYAYPCHCSGGGYGNGSFSRTSRHGLRKLIQVARADREPPRHTTLGGRRVIEFRPGTTHTCWAFSASGGTYVFCSADFYGPSQRIIGTLIASMRPITSLQPPSHGPAMPTASHGCGSFKVPLLIPRIHVRVVRGSVSCSTARAVMHWAYTSYEQSFVRHHDGWTTYGPQTCAAWATKGRKKITGKCGPR